MNKIKKIIIALSLLLFNTNVFAYSTTTCVIGSDVTEEMCEANLYCSTSMEDAICKACSTPTTPTELYPYSAAGSDADTDCYACTQRAIANGTWAPDSLIYYTTGAPSPTCTYNPANISCSSNMYYKVPDSTEPYGYRCAFKITLDDNGGTGGDGTIYNVYGVKYLGQSGNQITSVTRPTKANSAFTGYYYSLETNPRIPASGVLPALTAFATSTALSARFETCAGTGTNGTITSSVELTQNEQKCYYYITCNEGYENTTNNSPANKTTDSNLSCTACSPGYYCPGGLRQKCPGGMTTNSGATQENHCFYQAEGTKFCDSNGCLHLPINICDSNGCSHFVLHAIGMSPNVRKGRTYDDLDYGFLEKTLDISSISFHKVLQTCWKKDAITHGGSVVALSYIAAQRTLYGYNDMADAKALLESIARSFGYIYGRERGVRINTVSQSPTETTAGSGVMGFEGLLDFSNRMSPLGNADAADCADLCVTLFSDLTRKITMQNVYNDGGFSSMGMSNRAMAIYNRNLEECKDCK